MKSVGLFLVLCTISAIYRDAEAEEIGQKLYIKPSSDTECNSPSQDASCLTLSELIAAASTHLNARNAPIALIFLPGEHKMPSNETLTISNIAGVTMTGEISEEDSSIPLIRCQDLGGAFLFKDANKIAITNVRFENCGSSETYKDFAHQDATLFAYSVTDFVLDGVSIVNGHGYGLYGLNVVGNSSISNSEFTNNTKGGGVYLRYVDLEHFPFSPQTHSLTVTNTIFRHGIHKRYSYVGSGFSVRLDQIWYSMRFHLLGVIARDNVAEIAPNMHFDSASAQPNFIKVEKCRCSRGMATFEGGGGFQYAYVTIPFKFPFGSGTSVIEVLDSHFFDNYGAENPSSLSELTSSGLVVAMLLQDESVPHSISIRDSYIYNNRGSEGTGIHAQTINLRDKNDISSKLSFEITRTVITNNTCTAFIPERLSAVFLSSVGNVMFTNNTIVNNFGTGLQLESTDVYFSGLNRIENNVAHNGGGLALYGESVLLFEPHMTLRLVGNRVDNVGGGIYVGRAVEFITSSECYFRFYNAAEFENRTPFYVPVTLFLHNNTAGLAGNDIYGGSLDTCYVSGVRRDGATVLRSITDSNLDVTTKPSRVCLCNETSGEKDCVEINKTVSAFPGQTFVLSAITVGQYLITSDPSGAPSAVYASLLHNSGAAKQGILPDVYLTQESGRECRSFTYSVRSRNKYETIVLTIEKGNQLTPFNSKLLNKARFWRENLNEVLDYFVKLPVYVSVALEECPLGFEMSDEDVCDCTSSLKSLGISCSIDDKTIHRRAPLWIGTENRTSATGTNLTVYLTHQHCPLDFCQPNDFDFDLNVADRQCAFNRSGVLCGRCKSGLSAILGGSQCRECSNVYILLLIPFQLAGILLIVFLVATNMTVSIGAINGLILFANVIKENQTIFYPYGIGTNVLTVFIAWLNLDFGFDVCFFDGMDAYAKTWLQFVFPFYIWLLAGLIIVASRYFDSVAKVCGKNIVQVLATLFLLSYAKLQRTITTGLAFTILDLSNNETRLVWLYDSNIVYLRGIHVFLFVACIFALIFLFLPYTVVILFGPCLQSKSHYKVFFWVGRLKPIFDAYLGPYKDQYRYWTGVLLLTRIVVLLLSAGNVLGDASINLVAIAAISYVLVALVLLSGGVYKKWPISALECFFFVNLGVLSTVTLYNRFSAGNQFVAIYISLSSSFVAFCGILIYHVFIRLDIGKNEYWKCLVRKVRHGADVEKEVFEAVNELDADVFHHHHRHSVSDKSTGDKQQVRHKSTTDVTTVEISIDESKLRDSILEDSV